MIIDSAKHKIMFKIVWWGPAMSGKSTSVRYLFKLFNKLDSLRSIETEAGRTLFFDFGELIFEKGNWKIQVNIWSSTGQNFYAETRPTVLLGADGIIFIVDAQRNLLTDNLESWNELKKLLGNKIDSLPIIFCLNKWDLQNNSDLMTENELKNYFMIGDKYKIFKTIATNGFNIQESFKSLLDKISVN
ncbi:MAG: gliding-motility protein MglA [Promethearchaeota archaeon]|nr:MAG: gliding-motility protein MglA [Candidatus Lokiarchaeota archaeon]